MRPVHVGIGGVMTKRPRRRLMGLTAVASLTLLALAPAGIAAAARTGSLAAVQYPSVSGRFYHVAATSADDVWVVGLTSGPALISHWNGSSWQEYPLSQDLYFFGVSAQSRTDAWAVGGTYWFEQPVPWPITGTARPGAKCPRRLRAAPGISTR